MTPDFYIRIFTQDWSDHRYYFVSKILPYIPRQGEILFIGSGKYRVKSVESHFPVNGEPEREMICIYCSEILE